jgi:hypothetical protein
MNQHDRVAEAARQIATAIGGRDVNALKNLLAPGFVHRALGGDRSDEQAFLQAIDQIPGEIVSVWLERLEVDMSPTGALVTGLQHARVLLDGQVVDDRRAFVDWFVNDHGIWRLQAAVDLPNDGGEGSSPSRDA